MGEHFELCFLNSGVLISAYVQNEKSSSFDVLMFNPYHMTAKFMGMVMTPYSLPVDRLI